MYTPQKTPVGLKVGDYLKQFYLTENLFDYITTKSCVHDDTDLLKLKKTLQMYHTMFVILFNKSYHHYPQLYHQHCRHRHH